ncbi:liprin-beta-2 isoform X2 [Anguilla anguilla]|uniref:liprin-beta-2 isoform X2 n=1 Tax=Anguilla anguilla TaxID=7936 RepID=UPI0015ACF563|nr:liprin-beta-2 isoform X2 [Anguilla anguilla]
MSSDASHMLEAALEQMDDIIAGSKAAAEFGGGGLFDLGSPAYPGPQKVLQLAEDLRAAIEMQAVDGDRVLVRKHLPNNTAEILMQWLERGMVNLQVPVNNETYQDRLSRLEGDKESLVLQVSVLTEQVEAQGEKIRDLESSLDEHQHKLSSTEEMLQQELFSRTSLETEKLDLMDEVSHLKLKLVGMEDQPSEGDSKQHKAECVVNLISELQEQMCKFQLEISSRIQEKRALEKQATDSSLQEAHQSPSPDLGGSEDHCRCRGENGLLTELKVLKCKVNELQEEKCQYEKKLKATKAEISDLQQLLAEKDAEIDCLQRQLTTGGPATATGADKDQELQRLKTGMETLLAENEEKGRRIEELTFLLNQYRKTKEVISSIQVSGARILSNSNTPQSEMSSCGSSPLMVSSSSFQKELDFSCRSVQMSPESAVSPSNTSVQNGLRIQPNTLSSSLEDLRSGSKKKHAVEEPVEPVVSAETSYADDSNKSQTMPGKGSRSCPNGKKEKHSTPIQKSPNQSRDSAFALRKAEKKDGTTFAELSLPSSGTDSKQQSPTSPDNRKNQKAIHRFWGRVRKSQSGFLPVDDLDPAEFRRGGVRATAGPRLAQTDDSASSIRDMNTPFSNWTKEQVCGWLEDYGLGQYVNLARQWVNTGQTLLSATPQQLEKEIGIKNSLHRKKLQLALRSFNTKVIEKSSELDHIWVTRWLDDIGLPQYKDQFNDGRVDGRMIQYLTVNDLLFLKVTSQLHHLSIKCAIHVLHINKFNPHCLRRRPGDENKTSPSEVMQWSNHRVMEWLRSVDLAEYAPNLRGSGVHGGLIILEPRFNSDTLAMLLNIPPQKTLLRRHLATNFSSLVGPQAQQEKRECMCSSGYNPLTTTAKVRPKKLGFTTFGHLRRKKLDDSTDYICPLDTPPPPINGGVQPYSGFRGLSPILDRDREKKDQVGQKSGSHQASTHRS